MTTHTSQAAQHRRQPLPGGFLPSAQPLWSWVPSHPAPLGDPVSLRLRMAGPHPIGLFSNHTRGSEGDLCGQARGAISPSPLRRMNSLPAAWVHFLSPSAGQRFPGWESPHKEFPLAQPRPADQHQPPSQLTQETEEPDRVAQWLHGLGSALPHGSIWGADIKCRHGTPL